MIEFCAGAPTGDLFRTCLEIYQEAWWIGFNQGILAGIVGLIMVMLLIFFCKEMF